MSKLAKEQLKIIAKNMEISKRNRRNKMVTSTTALVTYLAFLIGVMVMINLVVVSSVKASEDSGYQQEIGYQITA